METGAESGTGRETEMGARTETWTEFGTEMEVGAETETKAESESESETETELRAESESKSETETETELRAESESESETETETKSRAETDPSVEPMRKLEEIKYYSHKNPTCKLSDPAQPHTLTRWRGNPFSSECFSCKGPIVQGVYYFCSFCCLDFHEGCHNYPPEIRHPFHLQHPLTLTFSNPQTQPNFLPPVEYQSSYSDSSRFADSSDDNDSTSASESDLSVMKCKCCRRNLGDTYYACSICAFTLDLSCAKYSPPLTINHPKAHEHTLTLLPRKTTPPCDACGLSLCRQRDPLYACLLCNYIVHRNCIKLPRVIKITRHPHRIAYTSSLPPLDFSCGVCRKGVDINCGQYSCTMGCLYSVHSKCATKKTVWDGIELEDVPLEEEEDIPPFTRIDDETIHHFNHEHHLRFNGNDDDVDIREEIKFCQACVLPVISDPFYSCMQCNFVLHEVCANRSLKIHHPLHVHPLSLVLMPPLPDTFKCEACMQESLGFLYKCVEKYCYFKIDARCASISEPFNHKSHLHPLYFTLRKGTCTRCHKDKDNGISMVECLECNSFLCLECATLPDVAIYKHDKHPLSLCYGEENTSGTYWCEICEGELDAKMWFYRCQECCLTLHIRCVLGVDTHMKPGQSFEEDCYEVNILPNNGNSRPVCEKCGLRCKDPQFFKFADDSTTYYCSYDDCTEDIWKRRCLKKNKEADELDIEKTEVIGR